MKASDIIQVEDIRIAVIGGGSWGTALAQHLAAKGYHIDLWVLEKEVQSQISNNRENAFFLPGIPLHENLVASTDLIQVLQNKDLILSVVPSEWLRKTAEQMAPHIADNAIIVSATKGIEIGTHMTMTDILVQVIDHVPEQNICAISGPSFAREVAAGLPTLVTVAGLDHDIARTVQDVFASPVFRVYTNTDLIGVELGGAVKNVMAIASGIVDGLGLGTNTRAALITRGLTEMRRLGIKMGAIPRTFTGLAGVGDLVLTCTADLSRNYTVGKKIGQGMKLSEILGQMRMVAEGVRTARSVFNLSKKLEVEMPIVEQTYRVLYDDVQPEKALYELMTRKLKHELDEL